MRNRMIVVSGVLLLGLCTTTQFAEVKSAPAATVIAASESASFVLASDGMVWQLGLRRKQLGNFTGAVAIAGKDGASFAVKQDGTVWILNSGAAPLAISGLTGVVAVAAGRHSNMALKEDGTVWTLGFDSSSSRIEGLDDVVSIAEGYDHALAVKSDGTVWAWGANTCGQLGSGRPLSVSRDGYGPYWPPAQVNGIAEVVAVAAGGDEHFYTYGHSFALKKDGTVWAWGCPGSGGANPIPTQVGGLAGVVAVAAGANESLVLKSDGTVWASGDRYAPVRVSGLADVVAIAAGRFHSLALKGDGTVWAWGSNGDGQLGDGTTTDRYMPVQVSGLPPVFLTPVVSAAVNAASFRAGPIAPGMIVSVFGKDLGPADGVVAKPNTAGLFEGALEQTRVLFDGAAAPLLYAGAGQLNAIAPYALVGKTTTEMQVEYRGMKSLLQALVVEASAPGIFTADSTGSGHGVILNNEDGTLNSGARPARRGSVVTLYATGEGQTSPPGVDGKVIAAPTKPLLPVSVQIGGQEAVVVNAGGAPGMVGVLQVQVRVPEAIPAGSATPVTLQVGERRSQAGVTVAID